MSETTSTPDPATFDLDAWLQDAHLPEDSCDIFKRADVISTLNEIRTQIREREEADQQVRSVAGDTELKKLNRRYDELLHTFAASRVTVYVRAMTPAEYRDLREKNREAQDKHGWTDAEANVQFGHDLLAGSIVGMRTAGGERQAVSFTPEQSRQLEASIGSSQIALITEARKRAQLQAPEVTVDFLSNASGTSKGESEG